MKNAVKGIDDFARMQASLEARPQASSDALHRKAVAQRKKRKKGGHK